MALFEQEKMNIPSNLLKDKYKWPPFSILNTISPHWQERVDEWESLIGDSTTGRDVKRYNATPVNTFSSRGAAAKEAQSVSTFDPFLTELMLNWFSRKNDIVLDPFAGGCTRGIVSAVLGRHYYGIDLNPEQVAANMEQYAAVQQKYNNVAGTADWCEADSNIVDYPEPIFNMVLTCPPYYNLEKYSSNPNDLSNLKTYDEFLQRYSNILKRAASALVADSFFVIVVSEIRVNNNDVPNSQYRGFVPDTIRCLMDTGLLYYNEIILENNIGSLPIRVPRSFDSTRKIGRHHQNVLVFYKGSIRNIENKFGKLG